MTALLQVQDLNVRYGAITAVRELSFAVHEGESVAVLGANGAGKSSLVKALLGWTRPASGQIEFDGVPITTTAPWGKSRRGIAAVPEGGRVFGGLSIAHNLRIGGGKRHSSEADVAAACRLFPELLDRLDQPAGTLSGGQQQMVAIARALMSRPRILIVDEVTSGLAPQLVAQVFRALERLAADGMTLLVTEQNARRALAITDRALLLQRGRLLLDRPSATVADDPQLRDAFLGAQ